MYSWLITLYVFIKVCRKKSVENTINIHNLIAIKAKMFLNVLKTYHGYWLYTYNARSVNSEGRAKNK